LITAVPGTVDFAPTARLLFLVSGNTAMHIRDVDLSSTGDGTRLTATFAWEDAARADFAFHLETARAPEMTPEQAGNALAVAAVPLVFHDRERRLAIDAPVCPLLADNLMTALDVWNHWGGAAPHPFLVEARRAKRGT
jgi:hypothetical protein